MPGAAGVIGGGAALEILGDTPLVGVDPLGDSGAAQRLQPPNMRIDIALVVAAGNAALELRLLQMAARPIDAVLGDGGNGVVGRSGRRLGTADLDDALLALEFAAKRAPRYADFEGFSGKEGAALQRRGFGYSIAQQALRDAWAEHVGPEDEGEWQRSGADSGL